MSAPEKVERSGYSSDTETQSASSCICWGRRIKKAKSETRPPLQRSYKDRTPPDELFGVKDANEVFKLGLDEPRIRSKHIRAPTKYPREGVDGYSTESTEKEKK